MRKQIEEAQRTGYLVTSLGMGPTLQNAFFKWCEGQGRPYATLRPKSVNAIVEVDFICCKRATDEMRAKAEEYIRSFPFAQAWVRSMNGNFTIGENYWAIDKCPLAYAKQVMEGLLEIAVNR